MTTPHTTICPHCSTVLAKAPAAHIALCPANPEMYAAYRAALEDPAAPGTLRTKPDYEAARGDLYSGTIIMRAWRCGWVKVGAHYGLEHGQAERKPINWTRDTLPRIGREIDEEIERQREIAAAVREIGLQVLSVREVAHNGKIYQYMQIR